MRRPQSVALAALAFAGLAVSLLAAPSHAQRVSAERVRAFAGLPDWSGLWETPLSAALATGELEREPPLANGWSAPPAPIAGGAAALDPFVALLGQRVALLAPPPYNPEWAQRSRSAAVAPGPGITRRSAAPMAVCSWGFPAVAESPFFMFEAMVTPEETLFVFQDAEIRHVYTDGRGHPPKRDLWPTAMGDSIGRWERGVLVVDTIARKAGPVFPIPIPGSADFSAEVHFVERVRRLDADAMQDDMTIDDPQRFAKPWRVSIRYDRVRDVDRMLPADCTENERNLLVDGRMTIAPP